MILREKILLGLCGVAALGAGAYYVPSLLEADAKAASERKATDYKALFEGVQNSLKRGELTNREERILNTAASRWSSSPLRTSPLPPPIEEDEKPDESKGDEVVILIPVPQYIGYIKIGNHEVAIIDGVDYRAGDFLVEGEFKLVQILPDRIKVIRRGTASPIDVFLGKPNTSDGPEPETPEDFFSTPIDTSVTPEVPDLVPNTNNNSPTNEN